MKAGLIQIHSIPTEVEKNVEHGIEMFKDAVEKGADLVVFPELWTCGYYLETFDFLAAVKENDKILEKFQALAKETHTVTVLPLPQKKGEDLYIGLYVIESDGRILAEYQKSFLWGREQNYFVHGKRAYEPLETSVGKIGTLKCSEIELPDPPPNLALNGAASSLVQLPARALDDTVFVMGINNIEEGAGGCSKVVSPMGEVLAQASDSSEEVLVCEIDMDEIARVREKIPYLKEYDKNLAPAPELR